MSSEHLPLSTGQHSRSADYYDEHDGDDETNTLITPRSAGFKDEPLTPLLESGRSREITSEKRYTRDIGLRAAKRHRKLLIVGFCGLVGAAIVIAAVTGWIYRGATNAPHHGKKKVTMDHLYNGTFYTHRSGLKWVAEAGDGVYAIEEHGKIELADLSSNTTKTLVVESDITDPKTGSALYFEKWALSPTQPTHILLKAHNKKQWRHSSIGTHYVHHFESKQTWALLNYNGIEGDEALATWLPNGEGVVSVKGGDLFLSWTDGPADPITITSSSTGNSSETTIFNGVPDWVYEEEVFSSESAFWISPLHPNFPAERQPHLLAYLTLNSTEVMKYHYPLYNPTEDPNEVESYLYPQDMKIPYPKPGGQNPVAGIRIVRLAKEGISKSIILDWPERLPEQDSIIQEVAWVSDSQLIIKQVDRSAEKGLVILFEFDGFNWADGQDTIQGTIVRRLGKDGEEGDDGWIECFQNIRGLPGHLVGDAGGYLDIIPDKAGYSHVALFSPPTSSTPTFLTTGEWEVDVNEGILGIDTQRRKVYFRAGNPSIEKRILSVPIPGGGDIKQVLFSDSEPTHEVGEGVWGASFSPEAGYFVLNYNGPDVPWQAVGRVEGQEGNFQRIKTLQTNDDLRATLNKFALGQNVFSEVEVDGYKLNVKEIRPPNFDDSGKTKYPVLFQVYGGPGSQMVSKTHSLFFMEYLPSALDYLVVIVDGRGTGWKGRHLRNPVKNNLGWYETIDQIAVAKIYKTQKPYVDPSRIGIWGWSYGGFMAAKVAEKNAGVHTLAMSVAPVTSWRLYDSEGYLNASIQSVDGFGNLDYLLAHGTGDDNVHFANTARLVDMLTTKHIRGWSFRMFTDSDHGINMRGANREIYQFLNDFLVEKWGVGPKGKHKTLSWGGR
ncbi:dipeptidyl aminopeptidase [Flagelloscypha sp. PMI_526]|nr:dipeptidyl aminopeptidase [Flagelloscypha sp. PMI_526]